MKVYGNIKAISLFIEMTYALLKSRLFSTICRFGFQSEMKEHILVVAVLIQEVICGDYAFVIHTKNPLSGDTSEIYAEVSHHFWFYTNLVILGAFVIYLLGLKTDCERFGRDIVG